MTNNFIGFNILHRHALKYLNKIVPLKKKYFFRKKNY